MMWDRRQFVMTAAASAVAARVRAQTSPLPFIDSHVHVWKDDAAYPFAAGARPNPENASVEMLLELMRANDVARTVIIQVSHYRWDNSYLASVLKQHRAMFHGVCRVDPEAAAAPDTLSRLTEEQGFRGVRLSPAATAQGDWISGTLMPPLWRRCADLRVPMTLLIPATRLPQIHSLVEANPELQVVVDHMADATLGRPEQLKMLTDLARYPKVYVKISHTWSLSAQAYPYGDAMEQVKRLCDVFGAKRLMAGTDWPISLPKQSYAETVALYRDHLAFLSREDHAQILSKTVQNVWPFGV